jgi:predicted AAA+ superfamily ATPase
VNSFHGYNLKKLINSIFLGYTYFEVIVMYIRQTYIDRIIPFVDMPLIKILTGVRRCGKSTIMLMLMDELKKRGITQQQIVRFNFDTLEWENKTTKDVFGIIKEKLVPDKRTYLFLDEIQEIEGWERLVNTFMEEQEYDVDIFVTGSNSKMMSSEISTYLTGRFVAFRIHPFSFAEYLDYKKKNGGFDGSAGFGDGTGYGGGDLQGLIEVHFERYLEYGGFPAVHLRPLSTDEAYLIVKDIYNTTILNDIVKRNKIRKMDQLERIVKFAFDNVGQTFSANSIGTFMKSQQRKIDVETIYNYLAQLEKAYILNRCSRFDLQGKEILKTQEKFYLADMALKNAVLGYKSSDISKMLENIVYLELLRRGYDVYVGKINDAEIDFIAEKDGNKEYFQVCYLLESEKTIEREFGSLLEIRDNYPKTVLCMKSSVKGNYEGIPVVKIEDWLLSN